MKLRSGLGILAAALIGGNSPSFAVPITYTEQAIASGSLGSVAFTNANIVLTMSADTANVVNNRPGQFFVGGTATFQVGSGAPVIIGANVFSNQTAGGVGFTFFPGVFCFSPGNCIAGTPTSGADVLDDGNVLFKTYDLKSSIGPVTGTPVLSPGFFFQTSGGVLNVTNAGNPTFSATTAPIVTVVTTPGALATAYSYSFTQLSGNGTVFIPILDLSGIVMNSLPGNATLIADLETIQADWPGSGNTVPGNKSMFFNPEALLAIPENGPTLSFSFLDTNGPIDGPILVDGTLLDPPVPGAAAIAEPSTLALLGAGLGGLGALRRRRKATRL